MTEELSGQAPNPGKKRLSKFNIIFAGVLLIVTFLAGFLPGYVKGQQQEKELLAARQENSLAQLRDLACLAYLQANQKDYGLAASTSTRFFDRTREIANQPLDSGGKTALEDLLSLRDPITAKLATGEAEAVNELRDLLVKTRQITGASSGAQQP